MISLLEATGLTTLRNVTPRWYNGLGKKHAGYAAGVVAAMWGLKDGIPSFLGDLTNIVIRPNSDLDKLEGRIGQKSHEAEKIADLREKIQDDENLTSKAKAKLNKELDSFMKDGDFTSHPFIMSLLGLAIGGVALNKLKKKKKEEERQQNSKTNNKRDYRI